MFIRYTRSKNYLIIALIILTMLLFFQWQNNHIMTSKIEYINSKIPKEFNGYKIVQISDFHNKKFGKDQERLLKKIRAVSPDIIVITGDLIDRRRYDLETAMVFVDGAMEIGQVYYVSGNHEAWSGDYDNISHRLLESGVKILDDDKVELIRNGENIEILGLSDPSFLTSSYREGTDSSRLKARLSLLSDDSVFQVLLSHRPELFDLYVNENIDLIFSGHAHGGQIRIPFIGAIAAPNQGFFPKYTSGAYEQSDSTLIVNRGLGNSIVPIRIFNRPEIIVVTLSNE